MSSQSESTDNAQPARDDLHLGQPPLPTVILRHTLPDGGWHYDWMIAKGATNQKSAITLTTFRTHTRLDSLAMNETALLERIADHREAYLTFEGPLSGNRGEVVRVAQGTVFEIAQDRANRNKLLIQWNDDRGELRAKKIILEQKDSAHWIATVVTM